MSHDRASPKKPYSELTSRKGKTCPKAGVEARIQTTVLNALEPVIRSRGGPKFGKLLRDVGIDQNHAADVGDISLEAFAHLLDHASRQLGEDCLGLSLARSFPIGATGVLGFLAANARDFETFVRCITTYTPLQIEAVKIDFEVSPTVASLTWRLPDALLAPRKQLIEFLMSIIVERVRNLFEPNWMPLKVELEYRAPLCRERYLGYFGPSLIFEADANRISMRPELLGSLNKTQPDSRLFATLEAVARSQLEAVANARELKGAFRRDLLARLSAYFVQHLDTGRVDLDCAATAVRLTPRELQAELRRRDTSFGQELARVRHSLAERYLRETSLPLSEIAILLGFSELSAFTRAARAWFDEPPSAVRQKMWQARPNGGEGPVRIVSGGDEIVSGGDEPS